MLKLDNNLLQELGLGSLPEDQKKAMLQHIYDTLELRVGTQLANQMTDQQLEEFESFIDNGGDANQAQALQWLEANLPNYKQVVNDVFEALKGEVKQMAPQIMAAAAQQPAAPAVAAPQQMPTTEPYQSLPAQPAAPAPQYGPQPGYAAPAPQQQPTPNPYQSAAPTPGPAPISQPSYQQPTPQPQSFGQPAQPTAPQVGQPQQIQPDPLQFGPQAQSFASQPAAPAPTPFPQQQQQPPAGPQFPAQQPPAGPGQ